MKTYADLMKEKESLVFEIANQKRDWNYYYCIIILYICIIALILNFVGWK
jgi:hypothetical protein